MITQELEIWTNLGLQVGKSILVPQAFVANGNMQSEKIRIWNFVETVKHEFT
jgi:hypothetical protein